MNSHGESSPDFTMAPTASMMCVCGEMGYAQTTSGRQCATVSATARDPSICRNIGELLLGVDGQSVGRFRGCGIALSDHSGKPLAHGSRDRRERDLAG